MKIISLFGNFYIIPLIATLVILLLINKNKSKYLAAAWISLILGVVISFLLKIIIARPRPDLMPTLWDFSFPSWHALGVFAILPLLDKKLQPYWLAFAILVSLSRLYLGLHYASDVIGGIIIGYSIGLLSLKFFNLKK
jgi:undecaprenyl-diphosphatase